MIFNENYSRIISSERIHVGKRIRDIVYFSYMNYFLIAQEDDPSSIGIIKIK